MNDYIEAYLILENNKITYPIKNVCVDFYSNITLATNVVKEILTNGLISHTIYKCKIYTPDRKLFDLGREYHRKVLSLHLPENFEIDEELIDTSYITDILDGKFEDDSILNNDQIIDILNHLGYIGHKRKLTLGEVYTIYRPEKITEVVDTYSLNYKNATNQQKKKNEKFYD